MDNAAGRSRTCVQLASSILLDSFTRTAYARCRHIAVKVSRMGFDSQSLGIDDLSSTFDDMREGLQVIDFEWRYVYLNRAAAEHGGRPREELLGHTIQECLPGIENTDAFALLNRCMLERVSASMTTDIRYPDGTSRTLEIQVSPSKNGIIMRSMDVTETRQLESQYRHAQKMEAIGRLAGSVAHDFNNALSVILGYSSMVLDDLKANDPMRSDVNAIRQAAERASQLTRQLLAFSRQQALNLRVMSLNDIVVESERMLHRLLGEDIELVARLEPNVASIKVDSGQLDQVIMNLAVNARDAMPDGGKLTIETKNVFLDEPYATGHFGVAPGNYVMLAMSDTGAGMSKETQTHIFEPFFTTKAPGKGTGLGLATVFGIVRQSGGHIWVYSEPDHGTTFRIYFPAVEAAAESGQEAVAPIVLDGDETILLVEDQDDVRAVATHILRRYGYAIIECRNGDEALAECERYPNRIHLLLTDVVMPHINGRDLAQRLLTIRPDMRVLYMSGYTENAVIEHGVLDSSMEYLQKPFVPEQLVRRVRDILGVANSKSSMLASCAQ